VSEPQLTPWRAQNTTSVSGEQPQTLEDVQVWPTVQVPQFAVRATPQLSAAVTVPQVFARRAQNMESVSSVQQVLAGVAGNWRHSWPVGQAEHETMVPQLSATLPHLPLQVTAVDVRVQPHWLGVTAPHPWPGPVPHVAPVLQLMEPPQPLETVPQFFPAQAVATGTGVQPQTLAVPPPPHASGAVQVPHCAVRRLPQLSLAVNVPQFFPCRMQNRALLSRVHAASSGGSSVSASGSTTDPSAPTESALGSTIGAELSGASRSSVSEGFAVPHAAAARAAPRQMA
jgi:hypothetical protein